MADTPLTRAKAAALAGCHWSTLQRAVQRGELRALPSYGAHGALLFDRADVVGWVARAATLGRRRAGWGRKSPRARASVPSAPAVEPPGTAAPPLAESGAPAAEAAADINLTLPDGRVLKIERLAPADAGLVRLTARTLTRRLDCTPDYLRTLVRRGELPPPEIIAGRRLWRLPDVIAFERGQAGKPDRAAAARAAKALKRALAASASTGATSATNRDPNESHKE